MIFELLLLVCICYLVFKDGYNSSAISSLQKKVGTYSVEDIKERVERLRDEERGNYDKLNNKINGYFHDLEEAKDEIVFIHEYLDVHKEGELDKTILGWSGSPEESVTYKLVKNKK